jgi:hypothetical protein
MDRQLPGARMPVTAKLSKKFYEKLGDDIANELVDWFNMVDATYRGELRELNEQNFARFDAKLEQRIAELRAEVLTALARFEAKFDSRVAQLEARFDAKLDQRISELEIQLTKRLFGFWVAQAATTVGLIFGVVKLLQ